MKSFYLAVVLVAAMAAPAFAQCQVSDARRSEAISVARLINTVIANSPGPRDSRYPSWEELGNSPGVNSLRGMGGPTGELARRMRWGAEEPLPGWRMHYIASPEGYAFSLTDMTASCAYTVHSDDRGLIVEGAAITPRSGLVPLAQQ